CPSLTRERGTTALGPGLPTWLGVRPQVSTSPSGRPAVSPGVEVGRPRPSAGVGPSLTRERGITSSLAHASGSDTLTVRLCTHFQLDAIFARLPSRGRITQQKAQTIRPREASHVRLVLVGRWGDPLRSGGPRPVRDSRGPGVRAGGRVPPGAVPLHPRAGA